jgi:pilus assembly protein TadC
MAEKFLDIKMLGEKELQARLKKIELKMQRKIVKGAMMKAARPVLALAKILVPVKTGRLRDSLRIRTLTGVRGAIGAKVETGTRQQLGIPADAKYFYPVVVEYKHQSFLRRAVDDDRELIMSIIAREIRAGIESL